jgi:hypothetical protein
MVQGMQFEKLQEEFRKERGEVRKVSNLQLSGKLTSHEMISLKITCMNMKLSSHPDSIPDLVT